MTCTTCETACTSNANNRTNTKLHAVVYKHIWPHQRNVGMVHDNRNKFVKKNTQSHTSSESLFLNVLKQHTHLLISYIRMCIELTLYI